MPILIVKELVKREVDDKVNVTKADLEKYYEEHKDEYVEPDKIIITEITLENEEKAKEAKERIKTKLKELDRAKKVVTNVEREIEDLEDELSQSG